MATFSEWRRRGSAFIWLSGAALAFSLVMIFGLVGYISVKGLGFFWPAPVVELATADGPVLGQITAREPDQVQVRTGNRDVFGQDYRWIPRSAIQETRHPADVVEIERLEYGAFIGRVKAVERGGQALPGAPLDILGQLLPGARDTARRIHRLEKSELTPVSLALEEVRLDLKGAPEAERAGLEARNRTLTERYQAVQARIEALRTQAAADTVTLEASDGSTKTLPVASVLRVIPANRLGTWGKVRVYLSRLAEFVADDPRESNTEGGIFPAIFGTVMMVLIMSVLVVPLGVMAALYMREYARQGLVLRTLRVAVNNLAGVPSIVFGVFGLGFFVYGLGGSLDRIFFPNRLPSPTFGTGGILWAALTLALLTVPVVIVATEEALAAVPRSQREASLALGATRWQTLWNVVIPGAMPGILTGLILAMARGAGEVAPLMLTGVVKLAPSMPLDGTFPFLHLDRKFMHLGFHIYDVGFQSPNSEAAKPMVFMTALLLLLIVVVLNLFALRLRSRLRARMGGGAF
ncbi:phosphate ABC transporter permease PstA [Mesoterricola sediminis]|uniref:Phosphate transport system permease protein PstA n=1 Tax=Mesoterricola sediminis TaxID=2927980 RepID=A0AA48KG05_9BACT|nr:phosphate ABC transporter permease PstA [Mesoterricola sediminis]BDU76958.1 phosphate transport system permease protein PstA [Mesoterricola sediminis]